MAARLYTSTWCSFALVLCLAYFCEACSFPEGWRPLTLVEEILEAETVLYGKVRNTYKDPWHPSDNVYTVELDVFCILKGERTDQTINITGGGFVPGHCHASTYSPNLDYIVRAHSSGSGGLAVSGAELNANEKTLNEVRKACGLNPITYPFGTVSSIDCPVSLPDCQKTSNRDPVPKPKMKTPEDKDLGYEAYDSGAQGAPKPKTNAASKLSDLAATAVVSFAATLAIVSTFKGFYLE